MSYRFFMTGPLVVVAVIMLTIFAAACSADDNGGTVAPPAPPPTPFDQVPAARAPVPPPIPAPAPPPTPTPATSLPITTLPQQPRTPDGGNVSDEIPPPVRCTGALDDGPKSESFIAISELNQNPVPNPFLATRGFATAVLFPKEDPEFRLIVSSASDGPVTKYVSSDESVICLESLPYEDPPKVAQAVHLDTILLDVTVATTGASLEELADLRDQTPTFLARIIRDLRSNPDEVRDKAAELASSEVKDALADGRLTSAEAAIDLQDAMEALLLQPDAPFLYNPSHLPNTKDEFAKRMLDDPDSLVIVIERISKEPAVTWAFIEPTIGAHEYHTYVTECESSVHVQLKADEGRMSALVWRADFAWVGAAYAEHPNKKTSDPLYHSSFPETGTYAAGVWGWKDGSVYFLYKGAYQFLEEDSSSCTNAL